MEIDTVIIGGGISGLSAALRLADLGSNFLLLESSARLGGVIQSEVKSDYVIERGPAVLIGREELKTLLAKLALDQEIVEPVIPKYKQYIWFCGAPKAVPKSPVQMIKSPFLSWPEKIGVIYKAISSGVLRPENDDMSVFDFLSPILPKHVLKEVLDPALKGIYGGKIERLSARSIFPKLWDVAARGGSVKTFLQGRGAKPTILTLKGGLESIVRKIQERLPEGGFRLNTAVTSLERHERGYKLKTANSEEVIAKRVLIATGGAATARFLYSLERAVAESLSSIPYASLLMVNVTIDKELLPGGFGVLFPDEEDSELLGVMTRSNLFPSLTSTTKKLLTLSFGGTSSRMINGSDEEVERASRRELKTRFGIEDCRILDIARWRNAIPQYEVGHHRIVVSARECEARNPGLSFIGNDLGGVAIPDRVKVYFREYY